MTIVKRDTPTELEYAIIGAHLLTLQAVRLGHTDEHSRELAIALVRAGRIKLSDTLDNTVVTRAFAAWVVS